MTRKPIISLDFDGVIHAGYDKWEGPTVANGKPTHDLKQVLEEYLQHFDVHVFSSRSHQLGGRECMQQYIADHASWEISRQLVYPLNKPPALVSIDDRAITFTGLWPTIRELRTFRPWNKK